LYRIRNEEQLGRLQERLDGDDSDNAARQRRLAKAIAESKENTRDFILKMRGARLGSTALHSLYLRTRVEATPTLPPKTRFWQPKSAVVPAPPLPQHSFAFMTKGWVVSEVSSGLTNHMLVVDNVDDPVVYGDCQLPHQGSRMSRPDPETLARPYVTLDAPAENHIQTHPFAGDYGLNLLLSAIKAEGKPYPA
jgi:hypothetical protein